jgi:membrane protein implicated in regulation of membrane protease activity
VTDRALQDGVQVNQGLVMGGAVLLGLGGLLGFAGVMLLSSAVVSATRRWLQQLERPPRETARLRMQQVRAATSAGAEAWRGGSPSKRS